MSAVKMIQIIRSLLTYCLFAISSAAVTKPIIPASGTIQIRCIALIIHVPPDQIGSLTVMMELSFRSPQQIRI